MIYFSNLSIAILVISWLVSSFIQLFIYERLFLVQKLYHNCFFIVGKVRLIKSGDSTSNISLNELREFFLLYIGSIVVSATPFYVGSVCTEIFLILCHFLCNSLR